MDSSALPPPRAPPPHTFLHSPLTREQLLKGLEVGLPFCIPHILH